MLFSADSLEVRAAWTSMPDDALSREVAEAANTGDAARLWGLCETFLATKSAGRTSTSPNTLLAC